MVVLTTFSQPTEGIRHRQPNTTAYVNDSILGKGTLYIAESCLSWISDSGDGFSIEYSNISLHAVSRDLTAFSQECLFLMLDIALGDEEMKSENGENGDDKSDDDEATTELRFVPDDRGMLDAMFHAMNVCQALHPDPEDSVSDEDLYEVEDDDIQMEETDSRMANLYIQAEGEAFSLLNNRYRGSELRGIWQGEGKPVGGRVAEDMVVGGRVAGGIVVDRLAEGIVAEDRLAGGRVAGRVEDRVVGRVAGRVAERLVGDMVAEDMAEEDMVAEDIAVEEGKVEDRVVGRVAGRVGGRVEGRLELVDQVYRVQGDRPFPLDSTQHQDTSAPLHQAQSSHMASHFSDAES